MASIYLLKKKKSNVFLWGKKSFTIHFPVSSLQPHLLPVLYSLTALVTFICFPSFGHMKFMLTMSLKPTVPLIAMIYTLIFVWLIPFCSQDLGRKTKSLAWPLMTTESREHLSFSQSLHLNSTCHLSYFDCIRFMSSSSHQNISLRQVRILSWSQAISSETKIVPNTVALNIKYSLNK